MSIRKSIFDAAIVIRGILAKLIDLGLPHFEIGEPHFTFGEQRGVCTPIFSWQRTVHRTQWQMIVTFESEEALRERRVHSERVAAKAARHRELFRRVQIPDLQRDPRGGSWVVRTRDTTTTHNGHEEESMRS